MESAPVTPIGWKKYSRLVRRNFLSVTFPLFVGYCIYLDLSRTIRFKEQRAKELSQAESELLS